MIMKQLKLSNQERDRLIRIKSKTGIKNWNVICRWALCVSLADNAVPYGPEIPSDSNVEMSWQTFGGEYSDLYEAVFLERCRKDQIENTPEAIQHYFRLHLNRGINFLASKNGPKDVFGVLNLIHMED